MTCVAFKILSETLSLRSAEEQPVAVMRLRDNFRCRSQVVQVWSAMWRSLTTELPYRVVRTSRIAQFCPNASFTAVMYSLFSEQIHTCPPLLPPSTWCLHGSIGVDARLPLCADNSVSARSSDERSAAARQCQRLRVGNPGKFSRVGPGAT